MWRYRWRRAMGISTGGSAAICGYFRPLAFGKRAGSSALCVKMMADEYGTPGPTWMRPAFFTGLSQLVCSCRKPRNNG
jgi:hypothetical protein